MALSKDERERFLAEPHIAALSVHADDGRGPLTVPMWYQYAPGGEPWVLTAAESRKAQLILAELGEQVVIYLRPQHWVSADLGAV